MDTAYDPWQLYYRAFTDRTERIPKDAFERSTLLYEAAHDAYETATNELTATGWTPDQALMAGRLFSTVAKDWVDAGSNDLGSLQEELRTQFTDWDAHASEKQS